MAMTNFSGEYQHAIDDKGRLTLPVSIRDGLGTRVVLSKGSRKPQPRLRVYPLNTWEKLTEKLEGLNDFDPRNAEFKLRFFSGSVLCDIDRQGRLLLNQEFRSHGDITRDVYIVGAGNYLEIYDKEAWETMRANLDDSFDSLALEIFK